MAKTNQVLKAKKKKLSAPYTDQAKMDYRKCPCDANHRPPPMWLIDEIVERKFRGGYNVTRKNQCDRCFQVKSKNGRCGCNGS